MGKKRKKYIIKNKPPTQGNNRRNPRYSSHQAKSKYKIDNTPIIQSNTIQLINSLDQKKLFNNNKGNKENLEENQNKGKKSILITKNTKIILKKSGKQIKVKNYIKDKGNKNINKTDNDIVKDSESDKNKSNDNSINQNYIVIKNDININNNKDKDRNRNKTDIISNNNRVKKPSTSVSNNIVKKVKPSNNIQKDKNQKERNY